MGEERETAAMAELSSSVSFDDEDGIAVITVDNPPVNALSWHVRQGIFDGLSRASAEGASAVVLLCAGRTFIAVDMLGAGEGDYVLITQGSSARMTPETKQMPIDTVVVGIVDKVHVDKSCVYSRED